MYRSSKLSRTMAMAPSVPQSVGIAESLPLEPIQRPRRAYLSNYDLERGLARVPRAAAAMESSEIRNRRHGATSEEDGRESSSNSSLNLTPSSSTVDESTQGMLLPKRIMLDYWKSSVLIIIAASRLTVAADEAWQRLARFAQNPFSSRSIAEETEDANAKPEKPSLKYEKGDQTSIIFLFKKADPEFDS